MWRQCAWSSAVVLSTMRKYLVLVGGSVVDTSATPAALAATALREEGRDSGFKGFARSRGERRAFVRALPAVPRDWCGQVLPPGVDNPLHLAVRRGCRELCELLLDSGCARDSIDNKGDTPLHCAVKFPSPSEDLCKLLLDSGCAKNAQSASGNTPLHDAVHE